MRTNFSVKKWCEQLMMLSKIAQSEPQAAYAALVSGFQHKLTYYMHTLPNLGPLLQPFDEILNHDLIPTITEGHHCSQDKRKLLSLPARFGGLAIPIFSQIAEREYEYSKKASQQLTENIKSQTAEYSFDNTARGAHSENFWGGGGGCQIFWDRLSWLTILIIIIIKYLFKLHNCVS